MEIELEFLYEYGLFFAKVITLVIAVIAIIVTIAMSASKQKAKKGELTITNLSDQFDDIAEELQHHLLTKEEWKQKEKDDKKKLKEQAKKEKSGESKEKQHRTYVIDFKGGIDAKEVDALREEITAILTVANKEDEVFVRLESGGGVVHGYGLAASQLDRIRQREIPLTISVDKVAASGGYMMACVANKIIAAPFAMLGSIGVIAQLPNFNKILKKNDIEFEQLTAGEYKRTLTMFGENTDKGREKFVEELEEIHDKFKAHVANHRPEMDISKAATGEVWLGEKAKEIGLVDEIQTSDDYLQFANESRDILSIKYELKKGIAEKLAFAASTSVDSVVSKLLQRNRIFPG